MGRPRKDSTSPQARQRIIDSFWALLKTHRLQDITVGMVVTHARCNRGTFYYHYSSLDNLIYAAIEEELVGDSSLPMDIFALLTEPDQDVIMRIAKSRRVERLSLLMSQGGKDIAESKVRDIVAAMWTTLLCPTGGELTLETQVLMEYSVGGILSVISWIGEHGLSEEFADTWTNVLANAAKFMVSSISTSQGIAEDELLARMKIFKEFAHAGRR